MMAKRLPGRLRQYWSETSKPLVNLAFVAPFLIAYEGGLIFFGPRAMRNGADVWLRRLLESLGFSQFFLLPLLICGVLLGWHHINRDRWWIRGGVLYVMLLESLGFSAVLLFVAHFHRAMLAIEIGPAIDRAADFLSRGVSYLGAGIYEELLFRLVLLSGMILVLRAWGASRWVATAGSILCSSLLFSAAHYQFDFRFGSVHWIAAGDHFDWSTFCFRVSAGVFFSLLFLWRGFGIAVGAHALYDILVVCL